MNVVDANIALGLVAMRQDDRAAAQEPYEALRPFHGPLAVQDYGFLSVDRLLALLARTMDRFDDGAGHFEHAVALCRKGGYRPELALTCCDYADLLLESNNGEGRTKATALLDESLAISGELGMRPLMERVLSRREILKA